jgi:hypothetical protein
MVTFKILHPFPFPVVFTTPKYGSG